MTTECKQHRPEFKAKMGLEALKGLSTSHELACGFKVHPRQIVQSEIGQSVGRIGSGQACACST